MPRGGAVDLSDGSRNGKRFDKNLEYLSDLDSRGLTEKTKEKESSSSEERKKDTFLIFEVMCDAKSKGDKGIIFF